MDKDIRERIDVWRRRHLAVAEFVDAWRLVPRLLAAGYGYVAFKAFIWYINLEPYMLEGCKGAVSDCLIKAPTTQHTALITALFGFGATIFGLYTASGKKWNGFTPWSKSKTEPSEKVSD